MVASLAQTLARAGRQNEARELLAELTTTAARRHVSPCLLAQAHAALGELPDALDALERAAGMRDPELVFIGARPSYAPLKREPRFMELRSRVGV